jgi:hypothetical protein
VTAPDLMGHHPQAANRRPLLNRPLRTEWCLWVALAVGIGGVAEQYNMGGSLDGTSITGGVLVAGMTFALGVVLRRRLRPRMAPGRRRSIKLTVCILAGIIAFGGVSSAVQEQMRPPVSDESVQALVEIIEKDGADPDHVAQDLAKQLANREVTRAQAERLADAARRSPSGRYIAAASTTEREATFQLNLDNLVPGQFPDQKANVVAGSRVCQDLPGSRRSEFAFLLDLGPDVSDQDAGTFSTLAVRMLCPERLEENWLKR